jgi:hypothetical protein
LPRFQPGLIFARNAEAEIGVKVPVHVAPPVDTAEALDLTADEETDGVIVTEEALAVVVTVTGGLTDDEALIDVTSVELGFAEDLLEVFTAVSVTHWE